MKKVIKIQTFSDIITNSSSEVFVCKSDNPEEKAELLREVLSGMFMLYRKGMGMDGPDAPEWFGRTLDDILEISVSDTSYRDKEWDYTVEAGDIIIESTEDNSIPDFMMDVIESMLGWGNYERHHLG